MKTYIKFLINLFNNSFFKVFTTFFSIIFILIKENKNKNKNIKNYNTKCALLVMGLITLFPLVPSGNFFNNWLSIAYYLPVGLYFVISKKIDLVIANDVSENKVFGKNTNKVFLIDKNSCEEWPEQDKNLIAFKLADKINSILSIKT